MQLRNHFGIRLLLYSYSKMFLNEIVLTILSPVQSLTFNLFGKIKVKSIIYQILFFVNRLYKS
jgi:hypothetical protein